MAPPTARMRATGSLSGSTVPIWPRKLLLLQFIEFASLEIKLLLALAGRERAQVTLRFRNLIYNKKVSPLSTGAVPDLLQRRPAKFINVCTCVRPSSADLCSCVCVWVWVFSWCVRFRKSLTAELMTAQTQSVCFIYKFSEIKYGCQTSASESRFFRECPST